MKGITDLITSGHVFRYDSTIDPSAEKHSQKRQSVTLHGSRERLTGRPEH